MQLVIEIAAVFLSVVGLLSLGWLLFGRLLAPIGSRAWAVIPGVGDGETLEQDVTGLLWLRGGKLACFTVIIVDCGLSPTGRILAGKLAEREPGVLVCPAERLAELIRK